MSNSNNCQEVMIIVDPQSSSSDNIIHEESIMTNDNIEMKEVETHQQHNGSTTNQTLHTFSSHHTNNNEDEDEACSDSDSIIVQFASRKITQRLTLTSLKPQQDQYKSIKVHTPTNHGNTNEQNDKQFSSSAKNTPALVDGLESIFTKTTAKTGKSSKSSLSSVTFRIPTCCGMIELNLVRVLSLLGMLLNIVAFICVAGIVGSAFNLDAKKETELLVERSFFEKSYGEVDCIVNLACATGDTKLVSEYYSKQANATKHLLALRDNLPPESLKNIKMKFNPPQYVENNDRIMKLISEGNVAEANAFKKSYLYHAVSGYTFTFLGRIFEEISKLSDEKQEYLKLYSAINMSMVLFGVAVSIPIVLLIFGMALTTDVASKRKLNKAASIMIMEAIASSKYNPLFRSFCEKENCLDYFTLLDNCQSYHELCEEANRLRMKHQNVDESASSGTTNNDEKTSEDDHHVLERNKYEIAFKIFSEFIDPNGENSIIKTSNILQERVKNTLDEFNNGSVLDDDLFDELEKQVCESMAENFIKFKQQIKKKRRK